MLSISFISKPNKKFYVLVAKFEPKTSDNYTASLQKRKEYKSTVGNLCLN